MRGSQEKNMRGSRERTISAMNKSPHARQYQCKDSKTVERRKDEYSEELDHNSYVASITEKKKLLSKLDLDIKNLEGMCKELKTRSFANQKTLKQLE